MSRSDRFDPPALGGAFPPPGRALKAVLLVLGGLWLVFAVGLNWAGMPPAVFHALTGNAERILAGEVWRLVTAPFLHVPTGNIGHILGTLLGLYFLGNTLERTWGGARFVRFLVASALIAYGLQFLVVALLPASVTAQLVPGGWFGASPAVEAVAIAWAQTFKGQEVRLFFVLPVSSRLLIGIIVGASVLRLLAVAMVPEGLIAPFGGILAGFLLAGNPSPVRRWWLRLRLARLDREAAADARRRRAAGPELRVLRGGRKDDEPPVLH